MRCSWKKVILYAGITVGGGALAAVVIGIAAPLIGFAIGGALGFSGAAAVGSASKTGVPR